MEVNQSGSGFELELSIIAPAMNEYEYKVAVVKHQLELYPASVWSAGESHLRDKGITCQSEEALLTALGGILGSNKVRTVIRTLISQSKS